ncbi:ATP-dependent RNA helicase-like protein DHX8 [Phyllosticta capitalensis]
MADLESLERLSLESAVIGEIANYLDLPEAQRKDLAKFAIEKRLKANSCDEFLTDPDLDGALEASLLKSIDRLVTTMHPRYKLKEKTKKFKGLSLPDQEVPPPEDDLAPADEAKDEAIDDTFAMLEGLAGGSRPSGNGSAAPRHLSVSPVRYGNDDRKKPNRQRSISRSRSRSPKRSRHRSSRNDELIFEDKYGRTITSEVPERRKYRERDFDEMESRKRRSDRGDYNGRDDYDDRHERKSRRRHRYDDDGFRRPPTPELEDDAPVLNKVYNGHVTGIKDFGAFVKIHGVKGKVDGLVHISQMSEGRVNHPTDLVARNQEVKVKVLKMEGHRISLSMKEVDQVSGDDLKPETRFASGANSASLGREGDPAFDAPVPARNAPPARSARMPLSDEDKFVLKQMKSAGVDIGVEYPDFAEQYEQGNVNENGFLDEEEDVDIEVREEEPPFLAGQTKQSLELSPIRVVKAPEGSLNRAAMNSDTVAQKRKELKQDEEKEAKAQEASKVNLSSQWNDPMAQERQFASDLRNAPASKSNEPVPEWKRITQGKTQTGKRTDLSIKEQRESLPVYKFRKQLIEAVHNHQLLIVVGDTGSGKTTQLTQYFAEEGFANEGIIGCTQPRRVAAMSVAQRVADEVGCKLGAEVGYTIRFEDCTSPETKIKYMTDGIMQREILMDPMLTKYSVIMLDEAHERTIATDVLFGLLKKTLKKRPDLKLIVTSATLDADKFSEYFNKCPIFSIPGRTYPVEILYSQEPAEDYLDTALTTVMQIHIMEPPGDILVFLTGKEEIDTSCEILHERMKKLGPSVPELIILPIYGALPSEVASRVFEPAPPGGRKVVIATNIAETSITIDGIYYVVDPGFVKQTAYDPKLGMDRLQVTPISQAQAKQRAGRAGRTGPGKCFRLYTESAFQSEMLPTTIPEIQRQNLSNTILMLKAMGINDLLHFDFMDPPPTNTMLTALEELYALSALDDEGLLTRLGRKMADFPIDPTLAKSLINSVDEQCSEEMLTIVAMISAVQQVWHRPRDKLQQADKQKAKFHDPNGDHLTLLNVYNAWRKSSFSVPWCYEHFIQPRSMKRVRDVREQLTTILERHRSRIASCGADTKRVRKALCSGFFRNSARKEPSEGGYKTLVEGNIVHLHPSSALNGRHAEHVIYNSVVETTREYMQTVTAIEPRWLVEAAPTFFRVAPQDRLSERRKKMQIAPLGGRNGETSLLGQQGPRNRGGGGTWG